MFQGFYNLTSGILTQTRNQNVISNNMTNVSTPGYKSDKYMATTFREELMYRSGNIDKSNKTEIGTMAMVRASDETVTDFEPGAVEETNEIFDVALQDNGFFMVQTENGIGYTRDGSFILDDQGYLALPSVGRVVGRNGQIRIGTDKIAIDSSGRIFSEDGRTQYGQIAVVDFNNYDNLEKGGNGVFYTNQQAVAADGKMLWKYLERSNVDSVQEMVNMMSSQRALDSASQVLKMYDQIMGKVVTEIGKV
ncbi:MAG: flagellar hook-basal body complex protein [Lachnospiraceae bacterium]|nr:flagellar hook-basal body complex protein [Lachnospiraceae bacterium]MCI9357147.1 flagellar hook-basal body complex protein [Lachnospiraceae bacterium]